MSRKPEKSIGDKLRIVIAMGTRPEIIKQAPLVWAAQNHAGVNAVVCHSGQHTDLAQPMLEYFGIEPDHHLDLLGSYSSLPRMVGGCMQKMEQVLATVGASVVVTQGDTATTAAISLACFYSKVPVVHVEAGLRTDDIRSPWPEEFNRRVATLAADLHCAPTQLAVSRLEAEGVDSSRIFLSGNPVVDALAWTLGREDANHQHGSDLYPRDDRPLVVFTAHRRENFGKPLESICSALLELAERFSDHRFVFVTHPNPNAGPVVRTILNGHSRIELAPPLSYPEFVRLMQSSRLIVSDSGGIQEEAPTLRVPLLITRESTERPEAVDCGAAELVGTDQRRIVSRASKILRCSDARAAMCVDRNPFGEGNAGSLIIEEILRRYGAAH